MRLALTFIRENKRFAAAAFANFCALSASVWWLIDSNWGRSGKLEIEPIVSCIVLIATLLGLTFVNDKMTRPNLHVRMSMSMAVHPLGHMLHGISVTIENHSIQKAFLKSYHIGLPTTKMMIVFLYEGFTEQPIPKTALEPGQAFSFNIVKKFLKDAPPDLSDYGDFVVATDIGYEFRVPARVVRQHVAELLRTAV